MSYWLWAVEARRKYGRKWELLPNTIMVGRDNAEWELKSLREDETEPKYWAEYRLCQFRYEGVAQER